MFGAFRFAGSALSPYVFLPLYNDARRFPTSAPIMASSPKVLEASEMLLSASGYALLGWLAA